MLKPVGVVLPLGVGRGTRPRREGRTQSVPEAGGTGAEEVATPTTPTAGHSARTHPKPTASTCGDRWGQRESIRQLAARGTFGPSGSGRNPNRER